MQLHRYLRPLVWDLVGAGILLYLVGSLAGLTWRHLGPRTPEPGEARRRLALEWARAAVGDLGIHRSGFSRAVLLPFANDPTDLVTDTLRHALERSGPLHLEAPGWKEKARRLLGLEAGTSDSSHQALEQVRHVAAAFAVHGRVLSFQTAPAPQELIVHLTLAEIASGRVVFEKTYVVRGTTGEGTSVADRSSAPPGPGPSRAAAWVLATVALPVLAMPFLRATARRESNGANLAVLGLFTGMDLLLGVALIGAHSASGWGPWVAGVAMAGAAVYNMWILSLALRLER